jgi:hypothetical protein
MVTTRQTTNKNKIKQYDVDIDFDAASIAWRENKKELKNGMFSYKKTKFNCTHICEKGKKCRKKSTLNNEYCEFHFN